MKIERLIETLTVLLNKNSVTAKELAERFGVSTRTIYRDIDVLSSAGVPVYTKYGSGGGIALLEEYSLNKAIFSDDEKESILFAINAMMVTKYPRIEKTAEKLGALFKQEYSEKLEVDFAPWGSGKEENERFSEIQNATMQDLLLKFDYIDASGELTNRVLEPEKMFFKGNAWYVVGFCRKRQEERMFRISRMRNVKVLKEGRTQKKEIVEPLKEKQGYITTHIEFSKKVLHRLYDNFDDENILKNLNCDYDVWVNYPIDEWFIGFILSFGENAKVIEPEFLKEEVIKRLKKTIENYN